MRRLPEWPRTEGAGGRAGTGPAPGLLGWMALASASRRGAAAQLEKLAASFSTPPTTMLSSSSSDSIDRLRLRFAALEQAVDRLHRQMHTQAASAEQPALPWPCGAPQPAPAPGHRSSNASPEPCAWWSSAWWSHPDAPQPHLPARPTGPAHGDGGQGGTAGTDAADGPAAPQRPLRRRASAPACAGTREAAFAVPGHAPLPTPPAPGRGAEDEARCLVARYDDGHPARRAVARALQHCLDRPGGLLDLRGCDLAAVSQMPGWLVRGLAGRVSVLQLPAGAVRLPNWLGRLGGLQRLECEDLQAFRLQVPPSVRQLVLIRPTVTRLVLQSPATAVDLRQPRHLCQVLAPGAGQRLQVRCDVQLDEPGYDTQEGNLNGLVPGCRCAALAHHAAGLVPPQGSWPERVAAFRRRLQEELGSAEAIARHIAPEHRDRALQSRRSGSRQYHHVTPHQWGAFLNRRLAALAPGQGESWLMETPEHAMALCLHRPAGDPRLHLLFYDPNLTSTFVRIDDLDAAALAGQRLQGLMSAGRWCSYGLGGTPPGTEGVADAGAGVVLRDPPRPGGSPGPGLRELIVYDPRGPAAPLHALGYYGLTLRRHAPGLLQALPGMSPQQRYTALRAANARGYPAFAQACRGGVGGLIAEFVELYVEAARRGLLESAQLLALLMAGIEVGPGEAEEADGLSLIARTAGGAEVADALPGRAAPWLDPADRRILLEGLALAREDAAAWRRSGSPLA